MTTNVTDRTPFGHIMLDTSTYATVEGAMVGAGLDYSVQKVDVYTEPIITPDGVTTVKMEQDAGIVGWFDGKPVPYRTVGQSYNVIQNKEAFAPFQYLWDEGFIECIEQAGQVQNGQRAFMLARLSSECRLVDKHQRMLLIATSHDGTGSLTVRAWQRRLFCSNQLPSVFGSRRDSIIRIRHSGNAQEAASRIREAILYRIVPTFDEYDEIMGSDTMTELVTAEQRARFTSNLFPYRPDIIEAMVTMGDHFSYETDLNRGQKMSFTTTLNKRSTLATLFDGEGNDGIGGSRAAMFQAAVEFSDYHGGRNRGVRILNGDDVEFKRRAFNYALAV